VAARFVECSIRLGTVSPGLQAHHRGPGRQAAVLAPRGRTKKSPAWTGLTSREETHEKFSLSRGRKALALREGAPSPDKTPPRAPSRQARRISEERPRSAACNNRPGAHYGCRVVSAMARRQCRRRDRPDFQSQSGRIEARTGLRMMPTFPRSPLSFRTAGFPRYGCKAGFPSGAFPNRRRLKLAPGIRRPTSSLHPPFVRLVVTTVIPHCVGPRT
jgi:hypothetical protein